MSDPAWLAHEGDRCVISIHAQPGAKRTEVAGTHGETLKIRVQAPPVEGAANAALIKFLAKALGVRQRDVEILSGERSRDKRVAVANVEAAAVSTALGQISLILPSPKGASSGQ
jgi:uncharacterized protein (TIGR00251 family)